MQSKSDHRAIRSGAHGLTGSEPKPAARIRPDHATTHGRATRRDAATRRASVQPQARIGASMDYQMGFTSGPSN
jgi:hypothetical protein